MTWLEGGNLWTPISNPSDWLRDHTEKKHGFKRVGDVWVKPAPIESREGNVITMKVSK